MRILILDVRLVVWLDANPEPAPLEQIPYDDYPEIRINEHERTEMPFRYVKDAHGQSIMPAVSVVLRLQRLAWLVLTGWLGDDGPDQEGRGQGGGRPVLAPVSLILSLSLCLSFSLSLSLSLGLSIHLLYFFYSRPNRAMIPVTIP